MKSLLAYLDQGDFERIHAASCKILEETGVVFHDDEVCDLFKKHGAKVEGSTVRIPRTLIDAATANAPRTYRYNARNPEKTIVMGEGINSQPNNGPVFIQDLDNGKRRATLQDVANLQILAQASDVITVAGQHPVDPSDVPQEHKHLLVCRETLRHSDMPIMGWDVGFEKANQYLDLVQLSFGNGTGPENRVEGQYCQTPVNPLSPLQWETKTLGTMKAYLSRGQGIHYLPCILGGVSGPMRPLGTAVLQNSEILSGLTFAYLFNPEAPVLYTPSSSIAYMKKGTYCTGTPDMSLVNAPILQMAHEFYEIPTRCMCGMSDSKVVDAQAGLETMQNVLMAVMSDCDFLFECFGVLDAIMTVSYEKHIIDEEIIARCIALKNGMDLSDDALSVEVIQEVGPGGNYLDADDTMDYFMDPFANTISECESFDAWVAEGSLDIAQRANKEYKRRLAEAPETLLDAQTESDITSYMEKALHL